MQPRRSHKSLSFVDSRPGRLDAHLVPRYFSACPLPGAWWHGPRPAGLGDRPPTAVCRRRVPRGLGYGIMMYAATPLAMGFFGYPFAVAAFVIEWHVVGMYAPGFVTGTLIQRFGTLKVIACGTL